MYALSKTMSFSLNKKIFLKKFIKSVDSRVDIGIIYQVFEREIHDANDNKLKSLEKTSSSG